MKNILITGGSGDLGFAIAKNLANQFGQNCLIILHYFNNKNKATKNAKLLEENFGCKTHIVKCDLSDVNETQKQGYKLNSLQSARSYKRIA